MTYFLYFHSFGINNLYLLSLLDKFPEAYAYCGQGYYHKRKKKFGYRLSNVTSNLPRKVRYIIRYIEGVLLHCIFCCKAVFLKKGTVYFNIMYFLWFELWTVFFLKKIGFKVTIVVHDFDEQMLAEFKKRTASRLSIQKILDFYRKNKCVAHNLHLVKQLQVYGVNCEYFPFPLMSVNLVNKESPTFDRDIDFLIIGTYRKDKNFETALNDLKDSDKSIYVVSYGLPLELIDKYKNVTFKGEYISDNLMIRYLKRSKFVILPYKGGNASGIPVLSASCGAIPVMGISKAFSEYRKHLDSNFFFENGKWMLEEYDVNVPKGFLKKYQNHFDNYLNV